MKQSNKKLHIFYWLPRILTIIFICFLAIFALDIFVPGKSLGSYIVGLLIHLIPNFLLTGLLIFAWKHEGIGAILFIAMGVIFTVLFKTYLTLMTFLFISFPIFIIGILFLVHSRIKSASSHP